MNMEMAKMRHQNQSIVFHKICTVYRGRDMLYSRGIWFGNNPLDSMEAVFMFQIVLILASCRGLHFLLRPLKLPQSICNILGGIILGPSVLGSNETILDTFFPLEQTATLGVIATFGILYFIFITAVKTDINMVRKSPRRIWIIGTMSWIVPVLANFLLYHNLSKFLHGFLSGRYIAFISCSSSMTYFPVIVQAMDEFNILHSELGQLATSASLVNQLFGLILSIITFASIKRNTLHSVLAMLSIFGMAIFIFFVIRPVILWFTKKTPEDELVPQTHIIGIILLTFLMGVVSDMLGSTFIVGILFMGLIIPDGPPLGSTLMHKSELFVSELFLPIFFARVGYHTNIFLIKDWKSFAILHFIVVMGHLVKAATVMVASRFYGVDFRNAYLLGLIFNIWGVVDASILVHWVARDVLDKESYTSLVVNNMFLTIISTSIIQFLHKPQRLGRSHSDHKSVRALQTITQDQELRVLVCIHDESDVHSIISLLEASNPSIQSPLCIYVIHLIQFIGREVPLLAPYKKYRRRVQPDSSSHIMCAFKNYSTNSNGPVTVQPYTLIAPYRTMHDNICNLAEDKHIPLMILPLSRGQQADLVKANEVRKLTEKIQEQAPCTLGILVENSQSIRKDLAVFSCNIQVLFIGGNDDREALALAIRMSSNPNVSITICRLILKNCRKIVNKMEKLLDDSLVNEFKAKTELNPCVVYQEMEVKDSYIEIINLIKSLDRIYDLVIVGKRRASDVHFEEQMEEWMEMPQLGAIGDIFVSLSEDNECEMSVLVMQQQELVYGDLQDSIKTYECMNYQLGIC